MIINIVITIVCSSSNDTMCMLKYINSCGNIIYCMAVLYCVCTYLPLFLDMPLEIQRDRKSVV